MTAIGALLLVVIRTGDRRRCPALVLAAALAWRVVPAFAAARRRPAPATIRAAVKRGDPVAGAGGRGDRGELRRAAVRGGRSSSTGLVAGWLARTFAVT